MPREIQKMAFAVIIFSEGFEKSDRPILSFFSNGTSIVCNLGRLAKWHNTIYVMRNFCKNIHSCKYVYFCRSFSFNFRYCFRKGKKVQCRVSMYIDCRACNRHNVINSSKIIKVIFGTSFGAPKNEPKHCNCI